MPVIRTIDKAMGPGNRPGWSDVTSAGIFKVSTIKGWFDCHYHDCHEYWLVFKGKAKVMTEGKNYYVKPGDIVCMEKGVEHDVLEIYEDLEAFWFEAATLPGGKTGHLHKDDVKAKGHAVPFKNIPEDF